MTLSDREKIVAIISNAITAYSALTEQERSGSNMYEFVLNSVPIEIRSNLDAALIDEVFAYVSAIHSNHNS